MKYFLSIIFLVLSFAFSTQNAHAADLSNAMLRLNSLNSNSALSGLACATPSSTATEGRVQVVFPSDFTISGSGWSTDTSDIPAGSTAWPGISFNSASSNTATFNSSNINPATRYCFNFTASGSSTGGTGNKTGTISTLTAGNVPIDSKQYGLTIKTGTSVQVNATIAATASDFDATLTKTSPSQNTFSENQIITYTLDYASNLSYTTSIQVQASFTQGTLEGSATPSIDVLEYVPGSATSAYNSTPPVIDTVNRTITWTISSFPGNTSHSVQFSLETLGSYMGSEEISFTVSGKVIGPGIETSPSEIDSVYQYSSSESSGPSSSNSGSSSSNSSGSSSSNPSSPTTSTPTNSATPPILTSVTIDTISHNSVGINIYVSENAKVKIFYGTSQSNLNNSLTSLITGPQTINISDLKENTTYYFKAQATNGALTTTSDLFTFKTASSKDSPTIDHRTVLLFSNNNLLFNPFDQDGGRKIAIIPNGENLQLNFRVDKKFNIKEIQLSLVNKGTLGLSNFIPDAKAAGQNAKMVRLHDNSFNGRLSANGLNGYYELFARIYDNMGNIVEEKILDIKISPKIKVLNKNGQPIENVSIFLTKLDEVEKRFLPLSNQGINVSNPTYSDTDGEFRVILPQGTYKAEFSGLWYKTKTITFTIGPEDGQEYPTVTLEDAPHSIFTYIAYYGNTLGQLFQSFTQSIVPFSYSARLVDLANLIVVSLFVLLTLLAFLFKSHYHLPSMHHFLFYHLPVLKKLSNKNTFEGQVVEGENKSFITQATIIIINPENGKTITTIKTNKQGRFYFTSSLHVVLIQVIKEGYLPHSSQFDITHGKPLQINISEESGFISSTKHAFHTFFESLLAMSFEGLIVISFLFEIVLLFTWGPYKILPFLAISLLNLLIWFQYRKGNYLGN